MWGVLAALLFLRLSQCWKKGLTPYHELPHIDEMKKVAGFGDAEHRGPAWYSMTSVEKEISKSYTTSESASSISSGSHHTSSSRSASSKESKQEHRAARAYRTCTPCAHDMLKKHTNLGIKWICGGYQRARRTFKSECMMRYRNCQDGTLFVKLADRRCNNDTYYGRHWFYIYKV